MRLLTCDRISSTFFCRAGPAPAPSDLSGLSRALASLRWQARAADRAHPRDAARRGPGGPHARPDQRPGRRPRGRQHRYVPLGPVPMPTYTHLNSPTSRGRPRPQDAGPGARAHGHRHRQHHPQAASAPAERPQERTFCPPACRACYAPAADVSLGRAGRPSRRRRTR